MSARDQTFHPPYVRYSLASLRCLGSSRSSAAVRPGTERVRPSAERAEASASASSNALRGEPSVRSARSVPPPASATSHASPVTG